MRMERAPQRTLGDGEPTPAQNPFVGRKRDLSALDAALSRSIRGRAVTVLVSGEPGIGKTRLVEEFAAQARGSGAEVMWGQCHNATRTPHLWPWLQVVRQLGARVEASLRPAGSGTSPRASAAVADAGAGSLVELGGSRFRRLESIVRCLAAAMRNSPLVVILDDLERADPASIFLLRFIAAELRTTRLLLVVTHRPDSAAPRFAEAVAALERDPTTERIELRGLSPAAIAELVGAHYGTELAPGLAAQLEQRTGGNPLFLVELARAVPLQRLADFAAEDYREIGIPRTIRTIVTAGIGGLSKPCREMLRIAATIGPQFSAARLRAVVLHPRARLHSASASPDEAMEEALARGILTRVEAAPDQYAFSHSLSAEVLAQELPAHDRGVIHRIVAGAIESTAASDRALGEAARHWLAAAQCETGTAEDTPRAAECARRAAAAAARALAYAESARLSRLALQALDLGGFDDDRQRAELWLDLAESLRRSGCVAEVRQALDRAFTHARRSGHADVLARAALCLGSVEVLEESWVDPGLTIALEEALASADGDDPVRVRLLARLGLELARQGAADHAHDHIEQATCMAQRLALPAAQVVALTARHLVTGPPTDPSEWLADAAAILDRSESLGDLDSTAALRAWRIQGQLQLGDMAALDREIALHARVAERLGDPGHVGLSHLFRAMRAFHAGELALGERHAERARESNVAARSARIEHAYWAQLFFLRREQLRLDELANPPDPAATATPIWRTCLAYLHAQAGRTASARVLLDCLLGDSESMPARQMVLSQLALLAETCCIVGDLDRAARLYDHLRPYGACNLSTAWGTLSGGPVARYLGALATVLRRWRDAERHLRAAEEMSRHMGAKLFLFDSQCEHAAMLLARGARADRSAALEFLRGAAAAGEVLGSVRLRSRAETLAAAYGVRLEDHQGATVSARPARRQPAPVSDVSGAGEPPGTRPPVVVTSDTCVFRLEGDFWTIRFAGLGVQMRASKGLLYLQQLLRHPNREFLAMDLANLASPADAAEESAPPLPRWRGAAPEPLFDFKALAAYRARLSELRDEICEAQRLRDLGRTERLSTEIEQLQEHLRRAMGLGGRLRSANSEMERARCAVTKRIRAEIRRLGVVHPPLHRHLLATIVTGFVCSYEATRDAPITWEL
jgi:hypothetical protein